MGLDDVLELLKGSHHLQRSPTYSEGALAVISGPFIQIIQTTMPSIDSRVLSSVNTRHSDRELEQALKTLEEHPGIRNALREKGYNFVPRELKTIPYALLTGLHMDSYVGTVNGEAVALGIVRKTGLVLKENGKNVAGLVAVNSTVDIQRYGCILFETGIIQFGSHFQVPQENIFAYYGVIVPPGVPIDLLPSTREVQADEYQICTLSFSFNSRKSSKNALAQSFDYTKKVDHKFFEPVFRETLQAARKLGADEKLRVKAYQEMSRCAEYAVMLANAYAQLQPAR